jgi:hypothetical protein
MELLLNALLKDRARSDGRERNGRTSSAGQRFVRYAANRAAGFLVFASSSKNLTGESAPPSDLAAGYADRPVAEA